MVELNLLDGVSIPDSNEGSDGLGQELLGRNEPSNPNVCPLEVEFSGEDRDILLAGIRDRNQYGGHDVSETRNLIAGDGGDVDYDDDDVGNNVLDVSENGK